MATQQELRQQQNVLSQRLQRQRERNVQREQQRVQKLLKNQEQQKQQLQSKVQRLQDDIRKFEVLETKGSTASALAYSSMKRNAQLQLGEVKKALSTVQGGAYYNDLSQVLRSIEQKGKAEEQRRNIQNLSAVLSSQSKGVNLPKGAKIESISPQGVIRYSVQSELPSNAIGTSASGGFLFSGSTSQTQQLQTRIPQTQTFNVLVPQPGRQNVLDIGLQKVSEGKSKISTAIARGDSTPQRRFALGVLSGAETALGITKSASDPITTVRSIPQGISETASFVTSGRLAQELQTQPETIIGSAAVLFPSSVLGRTTRVVPVPETRLVSRVQYFDDVSGSNFVVRPSPQDSLGKQLFFERTGTVPLSSDLAKRPFGNQERIIKGAAIVKSDLPKIKRQSSLFKDFQQPLDPFRNSPKTLDPFRENIGRRPPKNIRKTPLSKTFPEQPKKDSIGFPIERNTGIQFFKEETPKSTMQKGRQQLQLLQRPVQKQKIQLIQFQPLTPQQIKEIQQLKKLQKAKLKSKTKGILQVEEELFPQQNVFSITRFEFKEISQSKISPFGIFGTASKSKSRSSQRTNLDLIFSQSQFSGQSSLQNQGISQSQSQSQAVSQSSLSGLSSPLSFKGLGDRILRKNQFVRRTTKKVVAKRKIEQSEGNIKKIKKALEKLKGKSVNVYVGLKKNKQKVLKRNLPPKKAYNLAQDYVDKNIEASFSLRPTGKNTKKRDSKKVKFSGKFRISKKDALFQVEKRKYRLDSPSEKRQIKKAKGKVNWLK